jgi:hypothetical protein
MFWGGGAQQEPGDPPEGRNAEATPAVRAGLNSLRRTTSLRRPTASSWRSGWFFVCSFSSGVLRLKKVIARPAAPRGARALYLYDSITQPPPPAVIAAHSASCPFVRPAGKRRCPDGRATMVVIVLKHRDVVKPAYVHEGVDPESLGALLRSLFPSLRGRGDIVGIRHSRQGHFNNLALVCATLSNFTDRVYYIVTADDKVSAESAAASAAAGGPGAAELPLAIAAIGDATGDAIEIFREDVEVLARFHAATRLPSVSLATLWEVFRSNGTAPSKTKQALILKQDYFECVVELLRSSDSSNSGSPRASEKALISRAFDIIFEAFDHRHAGRCDDCATLEHTALSSARLVVFTVFCCCCCCSCTTPPHHAAPPSAQGVIMLNDRGGGTRAVGHDDSRAYCAGARACLRGVVLVQAAWVSTSSSARSRAWWPVARATS